MRQDIEEQKKDMKKMTVIIQDLYNNLIQDIDKELESKSIDHDEHISASNADIEITKMNLSLL